MFGDDNKETSKERCDVFLAGGPEDGVLARVLACRE